MLLLDVGNSRCKWALVQNGTWMQQGVAGNTEWLALQHTLAALPAPSRILVSNVAGEAMAQRLSAVCAGWKRTLEFVTASAGQCGVRNGYEQPQRLGSDRWAALIAARGRVASACLVVCAGTATTVDWLDGDGLFRGGLILPGFDLMRASLARNTAQLPLAEGTYCREPRNTMDAIVSGCLHAQIGAIERMFGQIAAEPRAICLLTGGAAQRIAPLLSIPFELIDNLILEGLLRFGASL